MRNPSRFSVLVIGSDHTVATVRAAAAPSGYSVHSIPNIAELGQLAPEVVVDVFVIVFEASREEVLAFVESDEFLSTQPHTDTYRGLIVVSDERMDPPSIVETPEHEPFPPWSNSFARPVDVDDLHAELDDAYDMVSSAVDHPLPPGAEEEADHLWREVQHMMADTQRRAMHAGHETPEETHALDFFESLFGDDDGATGDVPIAESSIRRKTGMDEASFLDARSRLRAFAEQLPEGLKAQAKAAIAARQRRRS